MNCPFKAQLRPQEATASIPTADSLHKTSQVEKSQAPLPGATSTVSKTNQREEWMLDPGPIASSSTVPRTTRDIPHSAGTSSQSMTEGYGEEASSNRTVGGQVDFFSSLGTEHKRKDPNEDRPDPSQPQIHQTELNTQLIEGKALDDYELTEKKKVSLGGPGYQWRMMKLKRLYEQAEEQ